LGGAWRRIDNGMGTLDTAALDQLLPNYQAAWPLTVRHQKDFM
jgi:hypothetical protein